MYEVSIIIPIYNSEICLKRCLDSVLAQSYKDFELILVNDGSKDNSGEICDTYKKKDTRVRVIHLENSGPGNARNIGLSLAKGKYILFLDSDDYVYPNYLYSLMEHKEFDFVTTGFWKQEPNGKWTKVIFPDVKTDIPNIKSCPSEYLNTKYFSTVWAKLYQKSIINKYNIKFEPKIYCAEDTIFNFQYMRYISNICIVPHCEYYYCYNASSLSHTGHESYIYARIEMEQKIRDFYIVNTEEAQYYLDVRRYKILIHLLLVCLKKKNNDKLLEVYRHPFFDPSVDWMRVNGTIAEKIGIYCLDRGNCFGFWLIVKVYARFQKMRHVFRHVKKIICQRNSLR